VRIRLRPHHLLCMLTFAGEGYTPEFIANFAGVVDRIAGGAPIDLVDGPDDVCAPLAGTGDGHCRGSEAAQRDRTALRALVANGMPVDRPLELDAVRLAAFRDRFAAGTTRAACRDCEWSELCTTIAADGFARSVLR
jgi:hypothetical protein